MGLQVSPPKTAAEDFVKVGEKEQTPQPAQEETLAKVEEKEDKEEPAKSTSGKDVEQMADAILDVISEKPHPKPKAKAKAKASPRRLRPNPQSSQRSHSARKAKEPFHFLEKVLVSQFDIAMWPFTCAQSRLPTEWSWRARRRTKPSPGRWMAQSKRGAEWDSVFCLFLCEGSPHTKRLPRLARQRLADLLATAPLEKQHVKLPQLSHDLLPLVFFQDSHVTFLANPRATFWSILVRQRGC